MKRKEVPKGTGARIVTPGEVISENVEQFLRGHGTYERDGKLISCICGRVQKVDRLITVIPLKSRYTEQIGDVVVGRITSVESKCWRVDIQSKNDARLQLSSINFPGSIQRRKTLEDEMKMREIYSENDVIVAEVQLLGFGGVSSLQTRSMRYGKLLNGVMVTVNSALVKRCKKHFHIFPFGVEVILGKNGYLWISIPSEKSMFGDKRKAFYGSRSDAAKYKKIEFKDREKICRVRNSILLLEKNSIQIFPDTILDVYDASLKIQVKEMFEKESVVCEKAQKRVEKLNIEGMMQELKMIEEEDMSFF